MAPLFGPRRSIPHLCGCFLIVVFCTVSLFSLYTRAAHKRASLLLGNSTISAEHNLNYESHVIDINVDGQGAEIPPTAAPYEPSQVVLGNPTPRFRDNLRNDTYYITSWATAGFTNQFMAYVNLLYLATLSDRVPILPPFAPSEHISREAGILPFSEIFNLTDLRSTLHIPILEWKDIKSLPTSRSLTPYNPSVEVEDIGCWSTMPEHNPEPNRAENLVAHLGLDPAYTRVPARVRRDPNNHNDDHIVFAQLAALVYPRHPLEPISNFPLMMSSRKGKEVWPDEQLACIDRMYYLTSGVEVFEWRFSWSPAWNNVGKYVRFNKELVERSEGYLRRAFGLEEGEEVPPFIAIHARHGDFGRNCMLPGHCLSGLEKFAERVKEVEERLLVKKGIVVQHYLLTSDETDPKFWDEAFELGWRYFDHEKERTLERFGEWQTPLVDVVAHSLAAGFVGTDDSTFSLVGGRRVEDWNDSTYEMVNRR